MHSLAMNTLGHPQDASLVHLLRRRAAERPEAAAYTFLPQGGPERISLTYGELDARARALAVRLLEAAKPGDRALLLYPPGLEFIAALFGSLYAGLTAVPAYPPGFNPRSAGRIAAIAADCGATLALTTRQVLAVRGELFGRRRELKTMRWIATDGVDPRAADRWQDPRAGLETLAYLQYTSGSTAQPKGVKVSHGNVLHNLAYQDVGWACSQGTAIVSWMPHFHDFGLVFGILEPLHAGIPGVLLSPTSFVQRPVRWLRAISDFGATHTAAPNFAYDLCVSQIGAEERATLDLGSLRVAVNGAEPVRHETIRRFAETFASCGFRPEVFSGGYGLAEATLKVTSDRLGEAPALCRRGDAARPLVGNGRPHFGTRVVIVDPMTCRRTSDGEIGEVWVSSPSVCKGYWNRPDETRETFEARLADTGEGPFLRTGDLGFLENRHLFITGRIKDLVIVRGVNHYPQDIELTVEQSHPGLRAGHGAAFSVEVEGEERLAVVYEVSRACRDPDISDVAARARRAVAEAHDLEVHALVLVRTGSVPMTSSGKIMRHACKSDFLTGRLEVVAQSILEKKAAREAAPPRNETERILVGIWQDVLNVSPVGIHDNFFDLGGNSLHALRLAGRIEEAFGKEMPLAELFHTQTIAELARALETASPSPSFVSLVPIQRKGFKRPFYCVHAVGGTALGFYGLARHLGEDRPFYGLQAQGVDGKRPPLSRIEDMAALYLQEIRRVQPHGPYHVGGMCFGGLVAYEMALQLVNAGEPVGLLAIFDTRRPPGYRRLPRPKRLFKQWLGSINRLDQQRFLKKVWLGAEKARRTYPAKPYPGRVTLFWSDESEEEDLEDRVDLWQDLARGGIDLIRIPGSHKAILHEPHVRTLARRLKEALDEAERRATSITTTSFIPREG